MKGTGINYKRENTFKNGFLIILSAFIGYLIGYANHQQTLLNQNVITSNTNHDTLRLFTESVSGENIQRHLK